MIQPDSPDNMSEVGAISAAFLNGLKAILADKLFGAYLYGAIVFPETKYTGDVDFHVILACPLSEVERKEIDNLHKELARDYPPLGKEMDGYYILLEDAKRASPPQSQMWNHATDNSWALHREHIRAGKCIVLCGPDPTQIYLPASWPELERALYDELEYVEHHLEEYPAYCVLNLCRLIYSYRTRDVVISKTAAASWAEETYPQWNDIIDFARKTYEGRSTDAAEQYMTDHLPGLYAFAIRQIELSVASRNG
jgi:hypothetical protein